jgi:hypothetical protein
VCHAYGVVLPEQLWNVMQSDALCLAAPWPADLLRNHDSIRRGIRFSRLSLRPCSDLRPRLLSII